MSQENKVTSSIAGKLRSALLDKDNFPRMDSEQYLPVGLAREALAEMEKLRTEIEVQGREQDELLREIEKLQAYANHERSLGAEGPMIELTTARQDIEKLQSELQTVHAHLRHYRDLVDGLRNTIESLKSDNAALKAALQGYQSWHKL